MIYSLGGRWIKNGSDYLTHLPLIKAMGKTGLPVVLSTGMSTLEEIDQACEHLEQQVITNLFC
ncbi:MAG: N-acetylneuraminate synthase family protein [Candidatus Obscuribacter sp.]|nr:N-acetylneuraminate synthase family protein [Candidatus Obscuribacter sp.]